MVVVNSIDPTAQISSDVKIWNFTYVGARASIGPRTKVGSLVHIDYDTTIGADCYIEGNAHISTKTIIRDRVFIGPSVTFTNDPYPPSGKIVGTFVDHDVVIGANSTILPGIHIGAYAVIGAGSVVTKSVLPKKVVKGVPAVICSDRSEYDMKQKQWQDTTTTTTSL